MNIYPIDYFDFSLFKQARVLVVGDVMVDRYWHGTTSRISPEAPVPIVRVDGIIERPGGAANVALGVASLGAKVHLLGLVGEDEAAEILQNLLTQTNIHNHVIASPHMTTIVKLRILSHNQQMIRLDKEPHYDHFTHPQTQGLLKRRFDSLLSSGTIDAVILSDYGKGTLHHIQELIQKAKQCSIPVLVDPKSNDFSIYRGATLITPNLREFEAVVGKSHTEMDMVHKAQTLIRAHDVQNLVITRSEQGMSVIPTIGDATHLAALAREVHDVTGAGDTVSAVLGIALALKIDLITAAILGNQAASIVVGKLGTATVSLEELERACGNQDALPLGILSEEDLVKCVLSSKARGERIVFTNGCFDILHLGHVKYLEQAKSLGDRVIVAVNTDASVSKLKGPKRPIHRLENRMGVLAALKSVDWVVSFDEETPLRLIQRLSPEVLVKGGDYHCVENIVGATHVIKSGGEVKILNFEEGCSTTRTIESILA